MPKAFFALSVIVSALCLSVHSAADEAQWTMIRDIDLTEAFHTKTKWTFAIIQEPETCDNINDSCGGAYHICFVHDDQSICSEWGGVVLDSAEIISPLAKRTGPLLVAVTHPDVITSGAGNLSTTIWTYDHRTDAFNVALETESERNTNEETRIVTHGPLAGDVIRSIAGARAPYRYQIVVYRLTKTGRYSEALSYAGESKYADGNSLAVIDAEMPEILRRLHLWNKGDALPVPARMHSNCNAPNLRKGIEWCDMGAEN